MLTQSQKTGISSALTSALFLGVVPIFGKIAITSGFSPFATIAIRTTLATVLLMVAMFLYNRRFFYIYPVGLLGCILAGIINGLGSILYYSALSRLNVSIAHLLYSFYPVFVALWLLLDRQPISRLTVIRLIISVPAVVLLLNVNGAVLDLTAVLMMLGSAILYALHLLINQRILYEAPAPTVTLYTLLGMTATVLLGYLFLDARLPPTYVYWWAVLLMAIITFGSRFTLFMGVKHLGGMQTAILGLSEIFVTLLCSAWILGEKLSTQQWMGAALLALTLFLIGFDRGSTNKRISTGWLSWLNPPRIPTGDLHWPGSV
jgi:drug/metabolite transporter (DMT)-like permease